ncbi:MAG: energy transducer TonB [Gammaproteobacteria bacterium]|nr:MAG: energy transducer TonB [Gammaproteobacteria bacterium]
MYAVRLTINAVFGVLATFGVLVLMYTLIEMGDKKLDEAPTRKLADIQMPDTDIQDNTKLRKPDKPEKDDETPPPQEQQIEQVDLDVKLDMANIGAGKPKIEINKVGLQTADGEYLPMVKVAPMYPRRAQTQGIEGYCTVEYTVTQTGAVRDPVPVDCQPKGIFESASVSAASKFKYKPRVVNGEPVEVAGVQNRFTYQLEK